MLWNKDSALINEGANQYSKWDIQNRLVVNFLCDNLTEISAALDKYFTYELDKDLHIYFDDKQTGYVFYNVIEYTKLEAKISVMRDMLTGLLNPRENKLLTNYPEFVIIKQKLLQQAQTSLIKSLDK